MNTNVYLKKLKTSLTSEPGLTIPNTKHLFFITVDASLIGFGAVLVQINEENEIKVYLTIHVY